jgi:hypothetical protein
MTNQCRQKLLVLLAGLLLKAVRQGSLQHHHHHQQQQQVQVPPRPLMLLQAASSVCGSSALVSGTTSLHLSGCSSSSSRVGLKVAVLGLMQEGLLTLWWRQ